MPQRNIHIIGLGDPSQSLVCRTPNAAIFATTSKLSVPEGNIRTACFVSLLIFSCHGIDKALESLRVHTRCLGPIAKETSLYFEIFQKKGESVTKYSSITGTVEEMPEGTYIETAGFNGTAGSDRILLLKICTGFSPQEKENNVFSNISLPKMKSAAKLIAKALDPDSGLMRS